MILSLLALQRRLRGLGDTKKEGDTSAANVSTAVESLPAMTQPAEADRPRSSAITCSATVRRVLTGRARRRRLALVPAASQDRAGHSGCRERAADGDDDAVAAPDSRNRAKVTTSDAPFPTRRGDAVRPDVGNLATTEPSRGWHSTGYPDPSRADAMARRC